MKHILVNEAYGPTLMCPTERGHGFGLIYFKQGGIMKRDGGLDLFTKELEIERGRIKYGNDYS